MFNTTLFSSRWLIGLLLIAVLCCIAPAGMIGSASASPGDWTSVEPAPLVGSILNDIISDRSRLIQVSFVLIVLGILLLYKK